MDDKECLKCDICSKYYTKKNLKRHNNTKYHMAYENYKNLEEPELLIGCKKMKIMKVKLDSDDIFKIIHEDNNDMYKTCILCGGKYLQTNIIKHQKTERHKIYENMSNKIKKIEKITL
jgi:hypothetical protein